MSRIRGTGTLPERTVLNLIKATGYSVRRNARELPGTPDIVLSGKHVAVFVHGCYWHRHRNCGNCTIPTANRQFWVAKFADNVRRDNRIRRKLQRMGWKTCVIWECETENSRRLTVALKRVARAAASPQS